jgi:hypothetical protein
MPVTRFLTFHSLFIFVTFNGGVSEPGFFKNRVFRGTWEL